MKDKKVNTTKCPVIVNAELALESAQNTNRAIRKFSKSLSLCKECESQDDCPILRDIDSQISIALDEIMEEWGRKVTR